MATKIIDTDEFSAYPKGAYRRPSDGVLVFQYQHKTNPADVALEKYEAISSDDAVTWQTFFLFDPETTLDTGGGSGIIPTTNTELYCTSSYRDPVDTTPPTTTYNFNARCWRRAEGESVFTEVGTFPKPSGDDVIFLPFGRFIE